MGPGGVTRIGSPYDPCRSKEATEGSSVAGLKTRFVSFFVLSSFLPFCSSSPMSAPIAENEVRGFALCASFLLFPSSHSLPLSFFSPFLALVHDEPAVAVVDSLIINK